MASARITAGLLIPTLESREHVRGLAEATGSISIEVESDQHCAKPGDPSARQFTNARPEIILVDIDDARAGISSLETLHAALPETRLFAISRKTDPKLIIAAVHAGAREFFPTPIQSRSLSQAIDRYIAEKQRMLETRKEGKIYCFTAGKEGSGVTTIAINVASVLAAVPGSRVALIDLDSPVGDVAMYLNLALPHKIADVLAAGPRIDSLLLDGYMIPADGFSVLPAPRRESGAQKSANADTFAKLLKVTAQSYTHTIIDLPRSLPVEHLQVVAKTAEVLVVVLNPELSSISRTGHLLRNLSVCDVSDKIRLVVNRSRNSDQIAAGLIEKALHLPIYYRIPENYTESVKAMMSGKPLVRCNNSALARSYHELARQLAAIPDAKGRRRLLAGSLRPGRWKTALIAAFSFLGKSSRPEPLPTIHRQRAGAAAPCLRLNVRD